MFSNLATFLKLALSLSLLLNAVPGSLAYSEMRSVEGHQKGERVKVPKPMKYTGLKIIPDSKHRYKAPGPNDQRGPCPGLNTMANYGYLPRNGIASFEDLVNGAQEAFNLHYNFTAAVTAFAILGRGNPLINRVSIGGESPLVPALPGHPDGTPGGLSKHDRFEGDVSMTRQDAAIGDHVHFQPDMFANILKYVAKYGHGDIVTDEVFVNYRYDRFQDSLARNPNLTYHDGRLGFSYGEAGFILNVFKNGTQPNLTVSTMTSFFQEEKFPKNWYRRGAPFTYADVKSGVRKLMAPHPIAAGAKNASGVYVEDSETDVCSNTYYNLVVENLPAVLLNSTGLLRQNVDTLLKAIQPIFADTCPQVLLPGGPAGV